MTRNPAGIYEDLGLIDVGDESEECETTPAQLLEAAPAQPQPGRGQTYASLDRLKQRP